MPKRIYKYPLRIQDTYKIMAPEGARLLSVQNQADVIYAWFEVESTNTPETWTFHIYSDGPELDHLDDLPEDSVYVDSVQTGRRPDGAYRFIWHIYRELMPHEIENERGGLSIVPADDNG